MLSEQRLSVRLAFLQKVEECHGEEFEEFFHEVMAYRYEDYVDVRTHGNLGDMGADGLRLDAGELYACYSPQTVEMSSIKSKFWSDLRSALAKRQGKFSVFVFVCNDKRGTHPEISDLLSDAKIAYPDLSFRVMGCRRLWAEVLKLDLDQCESLLGPIPVEEVVHGVGMADLQPLLDHLAQYRKPSDPGAPVGLPDLRKMQFNDLPDDDREMLKIGMRNSGLVEEYYEKVSDPLLGDEVASGFTEYYRQVRDEAGEDPGQIMWQMQTYVMGNKAARPGESFAVWAVLTHFFERCHIFESPPDGWTWTGKAEA